MSDTPETDKFVEPFNARDLLVTARRLERERDALREALRDAMMDCDHMILAWPSNPYEWQVGVRKMQDKIRAVLGKGAG